MAKPKNTNEMITLESGKRYRPKDGDKVECPVHHVTTTYGELSWIGKLSLHSSLDTQEGSECLLLSQ